jgi:hypothetical protein
MSASQRVQKEIPMKRLTSLLALGALALLSNSAGYAQPSALAETCKADVKQFCADVKPGAGKLTACIKSHFKDLSGDCQVAFIRVAAVGRDCRSDIKSFCSDAKSKAAVPACLKAHADNLSARCKDAMTKAQAGDK